MQCANTPPPESYPNRGSRRSDSNPKRGTLKQNITPKDVSDEMFARMLTVHCDQNNSYEITINGFQVRKINEIRNVIFGLRFGKPSSALRPKLGCSSSWVLDEIPFHGSKIVFLRRSLLKCTSLSSISKKNTKKYSGFKSKFETKGI